MLAETPCTDIVGLVIYNLPGRDYAAKVSNGELATRQLSAYESQYIDRELPLSQLTRAFKHWHRE
jgi:cellulose 1,4-beta-cellobiosidase